MNYLFAIIQAAFDNDHPTFVPTVGEIDELVAFGKKQSILPIIYKQYIDKTDEQLRRLEMV